MSLYIAINLICWSLYILGWTHYMSHIYRGSKPNIYIGNPIYCHLRCTGLSSCCNFQMFEAVPCSLITSMMWAPLLGLPVSSVSLDM